VACFFGDWFQLRVLSIWIFAFVLCLRLLGQQCPDDPLRLDCRCADGPDGCVSWMGCLLDSRARSMGAWIANTADMGANCTADHSGGRYLCPSWRCSAKVHAAREAQSGLTNRWSARVVDRVP